MNNQVLATTTTEIVREAADALRTFTNLPNLKVVLLAYDETNLEIAVGVIGMGRTGLLECLETLAEQIRTNSNVTESVMALPTATEIQ